MSFECELLDTYDVKKEDGKVSATVIFGRIKRFQAVSRLATLSCTPHRSDSWRSCSQKEFIFDPTDPMKVLTEKLRPVSRLGGVT